MFNALKLLFLFRKIKLNYLKNGLNISVITSSIIKNKISQLFFNIIFLNKINHLFYNHFSEIRAYYLVKTNKHCLKLTIIISIICYYSNKSNKIVSSL